MATEKLRECVEFSHISNAILKQDYREALKSDKVNAVHICTPNDTHYLICKKALMAGKHVMLEKPMATNAKDAWELVELAERKQLILQVGHIFRFSNAVRTMRDLVSQDYLGNLYYAKLQWTTLTSSPTGRDIIFDLGPHPIDILNYVLKRWPSKVTCKARAYRRRLLEELAYFTLEFDGDLLAQVELSWLQPGKVRQLDIVGSDKSASVDCLNQSIRVYENGNGASTEILISRNNTILDEISHFAESIQSGSNSQNPGIIGAKNVAVLESLKRSLLESCTIEMDS